MDHQQQDTPRSRGDAGGSGSNRGSRGGGGGGGGDERSSRPTGGAGAASSQSGSQQGAPIPGRRGTGYTPRGDVRPSMLLQRLAQTPTSQLPAMLAELQQQTPASSRAAGGSRGGAGAGAGATPGASSNPSDPSSGGGGSPSSMPTPTSRLGPGGATPRDGATGAGSSPVSSSTGGRGSARMTGMLVLNNESYVWGTSVNLKRTVDLFTDFVRHFRPKSSSRSARAGDVDDDAALPYYFEMLTTLASVKGSDTSRHVSVPVDARHVRAYGAAGEGRELYTQLVHYPQEVLPVIDIVLNSTYDGIVRDAAGGGGGGGSASMTDGDGSLRPSTVIRSRIFNLEDSEFRRMRDLNPSDIDMLVTIKGMVTRTHGVMPDPRSSWFTCQSCGEGVEIDIEKGRVEEPTACSSCGTKHSMLRIDNRGHYLDKQKIKMQEAPESVPDGEAPHSVSLYLFENMCESVVPGDRVTVTGIYRAIPTRTNPRVRSSKSVFTTFLDVIHFASQEKGRLTQQAFLEGERPAPEEADGADALESKSSIDARRARCEAMASSPTLYTDLAHSLAPSVWEMEDVKKGLLLMLLGGCRKDLGREGKIRGEINILLCGDPGAAKSQLLRYVHERAPRGIYTSGKGSSAVGLTASIVKDPDTKEPVLESGALVLSDRGICCIDEFDKMSDATRSILHEVMEQQTVSIAKAGVIATLNARTSILASANPVESRYNPRLSVVENIQLPPTLLSRFDLIYLVLDHERPESDRRLAEHLVSLFQDESVRTAKPSAYNIDELATFISYAKEHCEPAITEEAAQELSRGYLDMRRGGLAGGKHTITATTRQLESLIRLSEAHARMRLSPEVHADDVIEAVRLMSVATQRAAVNPRTGTIDMDLITTGHAAGARDAIGQMADALRERLLARAIGSRHSAQALVKELAGDTSMPVELDDVRSALRQLATEDQPVIRMERDTATVINSGGGF